MGIILQLAYMTEVGGEGVAEDTGTIAEEMNLVALAAGGERSLTTVAVKVAFAVAGAELLAKPLPPLEEDGVEVDSKLPLTVGLKNTDEEEAEEGDR